MHLPIVKVVLFCVYASVCLRGSHGKTVLSKNVSVSAVLVFGDSMVDQGNNNYINNLGKGNYLPYGMDFMGGKPTGRFTNGKTLADLFGEAFGVKEYLPASLDPLITDNDFKTGVSFASGGSGYDQLTTTISTGLSMSDQLNMFKQYVEKIKRNIGKQGADEIINNSVAVIIAGNNDLLLALPIRKLQYDVPSYANKIVSMAIDFIQELYALGVRRIAVFSAFPHGCMPAVRTLDGGLDRNCDYEKNNIAQMFNKILKQKLQFWETSYPQSRIAFIDSYNSMMSIIENPHVYGFDVVDKGCCGTGKIETVYLCNKLTAPTCPDRSKYLFWDGFHTSEKGNRVVLNLILQDMVNTLF